MTRFVDKRLLLGASLLLTLVAVGTAIGFRTTAQLNENAARVVRTQEVLTSLEGLLSAMKDAETGQRGFLITGDERYLEPYRAALAGVKRQSETLRRLTVDNAAQHPRLPLLENLVNAKLEELARTIDVRNREGFDAARQEVETHLGKSRMDALRSAVGAMEENERRLLRERQSSTQSAYRIAFLTRIGMTSLIALSIVAFSWLLHRALEERRKAAAVAHEQREWLRTTLGSIGDAVIATDTEGRLTFLNTVAEGLTGWTEAEANGQPIERIFQIVNEETRRTVESPIVRALAEGTIVGSANHTILIANDGTERPIDDSASPIRDEAGRVIGCVLVFRDITARRQEEDERRRRLNQVAEAEERMRAVVNNVVDGLITIDEHGTVQTFNPAAERQFGYTDAEVIGKKIQMLMPDPYRSEHDTYLANYRHTGIAKVIGKGREVEGRRKDGSTFPMDLAVSEFHIGKERYFSGIVRDITEQKTVEEALRDADRRKDEFLATLAHELRNPLASLRIGSELLLRAEGEADLIKEAATVMDRQTRTMVRLVDDLMDMSRIAQGKIELRWEVVDLAAVLRSAAETCRPAIEVGGHELTVALPPEPILLHADATRLTQVFTNLLTNAAKYSNARGAIRVTAERDEGHVIVSVKDHGIGIAPDMLPRIFELFTQVHRNAERSHGGLGIGLSLVKRLVELHGGIVKARSEGLGRGSEFVIRLAIYVETKESLDVPMASDDMQPPSPRRVLIVDDEKDNADTLAILLQRDGHETRVAYDGLAAVAATNEFRPDAVLLDIDLPKLNGLEACRRIREHSWGQNILLIAISGWVQEEDRQKSRDAGFDMHLTKPVDFENLAGVLNAASVPR